MKEDDQEETSIILSRSVLPQGIINGKLQLQQEHMEGARLLHLKKQLQDELPFDTYVTIKLTSKKISK